MQLKLSCYHLKMDYFMYEVFYVSLLVITKEMPTMHLQKIKEVESENTVMENDQFIKLGRKEGKKTM